MKTMRLESVKGEAARKVVLEVGPVGRITRLEALVSNEAHTELAKLLAVGLPEVTLVEIECANCAELSELISAEEFCPTCQVEAFEEKTAMEENLR